MAKNPQKVQSFLSGLAQKLQPIWTKERAELLKLKEEEVDILQLLLHNPGLVIFTFFTVSQA